MQAFEPDPQHCQVAIGNGGSGQRVQAADQTVFQPGGVAVDLSHHVLFPDDEHCRQLSALGDLRDDRDGRGGKLEPTSQPAILEETPRSQHSSRLSRRSTLITPLPAKLQECFLPEKRRRRLQFNNDMLLLFALLFSF